MRKNAKNAEEKAARPERYCYIGPSIAQNLRGAKVAFIKGSVFKGKTPEQLTEGVEPTLGAAIREFLVPVEEMAAYRNDMQSGSPLWAGRVRKLEEALRNNNKRR